jgi:hypothetical protein
MTTPLHKILTSPLRWDWSRGDFIREDAATTTWALSNQTWILKSGKQSADGAMIHLPPWPEDHSSGEDRWWAARKP